MGRTVCNSNDAECSGCVGMLTVKDIEELLTKVGQEPKDVLSVEDIAKLMFGEDFENAKKDS